MADIDWLTMLTMFMLSAWLFYAEPSKRTARHRLLVVLISAPWVILAGFHEHIARIDVPDPLAIFALVVMVADFTVWIVLWSCHLHWFTTQLRQVTRTAAVDEVNDTNSGEAGRRSRDVHRTI